MKTQVKPVCVRCHNHIRPDGVWLNTANQTFCLSCASWEPESMVKLSTGGVQQGGAVGHTTGVTDPSGTGRKADTGKDSWHLLPWDAVRVIVVVLAFGAKKYGDRNWEGGMDWERVFRAAIGHLTKWWQGENLDEETGYRHLWHAGCCVLFLIAFELRGIGKDSRPKVAPHPKSHEKTNG